MAHHRNVLYGACGEMMICIQKSRSNVTEVVPVVNICSHTDPVPIMTGPVPYGTPSKLTGVDFKPIGFELGGGCVGGCGCCPRGNCEGRQIYVQQARSSEISLRAFPS